MGKYVGYAMAIQSAVFALLFYSLISTESFFDKLIISAALILCTVHMLLEIFWYWDDEDVMHAAHISHPNHSKDAFKISLVGDDEWHQETGE